MNYSDLQLRSKTFLDFTNDPKIMDEIIGGHSKADIAYFLRTVSPDNAPVSEEERAITFIGFTGYCDDKKLTDAIRAEFEDEYNAVFNE